MKKFSKILVSLLCIITLLVPSVSHAGIGIESNVKHYYVGEQKNGTVLLSYEADAVVPIASITKLMTYMVTEDAIKSGQVHLNDRIVITEDIEKTPGSSMDLKKGESVTLDELIKGMMIVSGNDACVAIAKHISGSEANFVEKMNNKAKEIGLNSFTFHNASGYPFEGKDNTMSVKDVFNMARYLVENYPQVLELSQMRVLDMPERNFHKEALVPLVGDMPGVDGLKTGTTDAAGHCLISTFKVPGSEGSEGFRAISVVMGTETKEIRNKVARYIIEYVQKNFKYQKVVDVNEPFDQIHLNALKDPVVELYPEKDITLLVNQDRGYQIQKDISEDVKGPIEASTVMGKIIIQPEGQQRTEVNLITRKSYPLASMGTRLSRLFSFIGNFLRELLYI